MSQRHFLSQLVESNAPAGVQVERTGEWLVRNLECALDSRSRRQGLLPRECLAPGTGLVIAPSQGIHTFGMRFPLDIVAVARDGRVVKVRATVPPRRIVLAFSAFAIIEVAAGSAAAAGLRVEDRLVVRPSPL